MIRLTDAPIDVAAVEAAVARPTAGAVVTFLGTTRGVTGGVTTLHLAYEAHRDLALQEMERLADEVRRQWPGTAVAIVHRLGRVDVGEASVAIAVSSAHRAVAFEACRAAIDRLKERVPIWKQEHYADGRTEWVHPGLPAAASRPAVMAAPDASAGGRP